jgi:hypothetical protein
MNALTVSIVGAWLLLLAFLLAYLGRHGRMR